MYSLGQNWVNLMRDFYAILDVISDQEVIWRDTLADDNPAIEEEIRQGGRAPTEVDPRLLHDIQVAVTRLVEKASQLLGNSTTNLAECWMHIRSKFDGGKVINRSQSGSWQHRCMGARLRQNMGSEWGPETWKRMAITSPNKVYADAADRSAKRVEKDRKRKATDKAKESRRRSKYMRLDDTPAARKAYSRHDDGLLPDEVTDDIPPEQLKQLAGSFYSTKVDITGERAEEIERHTRNQADSGEWMIERRLRLTASRVGGIAKMRQTTKKSQKVKEILYSSFRGNRATQYGSAMEDETRLQYIAHQQGNGHPGLLVDNCGLAISLTNPWLAASPDGSVNDPNDPDPLGLLEIKNPFTAKEKTIAEACTSSFCLERKDDTFKLKRRHDYYFQIQCQLYCTDRNWCDFTVRTNKGIHVERIFRDIKWWGLQLAKLRKFYFSALLPELACPRHKRGGIREPQ